MSIHHDVTLSCDGFYFWEAEDVFCTTDVVGRDDEEVIAKAKAQGWWISVPSWRGPVDLCPACTPPAREERQREQHERFDRIKATPCPKCGAAAGRKCVTSGGKPVAAWGQCHQLRLIEAGA